MGMFDYFTNPQKAVEDVTDSVRGAAAKVGEAPGGILNSISGFAHGVMGSLWSGATYTAILLGLRTLAPSLYNAGVKMIGGQEALDKQMIENEKGVPTLAIDSAIKGFGLAAALGGTQGAFQGGGGGIVGTAAAGLVMATVAAVTIGKVFDGGAPATPSPARPKAEQAKA